MKKFNGKAIYNPSGKAGEYSYWACNFFNGCSNYCTYCYLKKGVLKPALGGDKPTLKKCFKNEEHALQIFEKELWQNIVELKKYGLFFSFTTDPLLPETKRLTIAAVKMCNFFSIPVKVLTKQVGYVYLLGFSSDIIMDKSLIAVGFTLTGHDELEPGASSNEKRIIALKTAKKSGYKTFASIEPIIDFSSSLKMIEETLPFCDLYKIGLESGKKYDIKEVRHFIDKVYVVNRAWQKKIYFKDSLLKCAGILRNTLPDNCVERDYNLFND